MANWILWHSAGPPANVRTSVDNALPSDTMLTLGEVSSNTIGTYNLNGKNQTVAAIQTAGTGTTQTITTFAGNSTLTVAPTGNNNYGGLLSGNLGLVKAAGGTLTLSKLGGNSYSGGTTISNGALYVTNTSNSATGNGGVLVQAAGTLAGNGIKSSPWQPWTKRLRKMLWI